MSKQIFILCLCLWGGIACGQKYLSLENPKKFKRIIFQPGDYIRFQTRDGNARYHGTIEAVYDSVVVLVKTIKMANSGDATNNVFRDYVPLHEIQAVYNGKKSYGRYFRNMYAAAATIGGGALIGITSLNTLLERGKPDQTSLIIASGLLTSGLIVRYLGRNKWKIGNQWQLHAREPMVLDRELLSTPTEN